jgi:hypothetical protein
VFDKNLLVKPCVDDKIVSHCDSLGPHGMFLGIDEFADDGIVEISDLFVSGIVFNIHVK